jgi:hypothetical protein
VLRLLEDGRAPGAQPVLPATLGAEAEVLLMRRPGAHTGELQVLHLWRAPARLDDGSPLWLGSVQAMRYTRPLHAIGLWQPAADGGRANAAMRGDLAALPVRIGTSDGMSVARVDTRGIRR